LLKARLAMASIFDFLLSFSIDLKQPLAMVSRMLSEAMRHFCSSSKKDS
jgi:hypothetical protein